MYNANTCNNITRTIVPSIMIIVQNFGLVSISQSIIKCAIDHLCTSKPRKPEIKMVTKTGFFRQATTQCSMIAIQNAPVGAFCNARMLHLALRCGENHATCRM